MTCWQGMGPGKPGEPPTVSSKSNGRIWFAIAIGPVQSYVDLDEMESSRPSSGRKDWKKGPGRESVTKRVGPRSAGKTQVG